MSLDHLTPKESEEVIDRVNYILRELTHLGAEIGRIQEYISIHEGYDDEDPREIDFNE